jgi:hypothetical protein
MSRVQRRRIGDVLVNEGLVSRENLESALEIQSKTGETLSGVLVDMGCVADHDVTRIVCQHYQLPFVRLANYDVDSKLVKLFPPEFLHLNKILPFDRIGQMLLCSVVEIPGDEILAEIPRTTRHNAALYVGALTEVDHYLQQLYPLPEGSELPKYRRKEADKKSAEKSGGKPDAARQVGKIFNEESSEAILEALDSTWDSIFDTVDSGGGKQE